MQIGKICKTLGYGGMLCSALVFANPCQGENQFIFDTTNASYAPSTSPLIINQYVSAEFVDQNADTGALLFQNAAALSIDVHTITEANALALYNGIDFTMASNAGALTLTGGTSDGASAYNGSAILVQREEGYSTYWDGICNDAVGGPLYATQADANGAKAISTSIALDAAAGQTITGQYGIKIVGLRSASAGHGTTNDSTDYAGDIVNITLGGTGTNSISGTSGAIYRDSASGEVNVNILDSSTWSLTGSSTVEGLNLEDGSTLNLKLQGTPADNTSGVSVMTVNTGLTLPTTTAATVGLEWQKVSNPANADSISQAYLVFPSGAADWTKLKLKMLRTADPVGSGADLKLDEADRILLVSGNDLSTGTEFPLANLLFNEETTASSAWFTDGAEGAFELLRAGGNLYASVVSDSLKISHYFYPAAITKRVAIYPRFATIGNIPSLKLSFDASTGPDDDCNGTYAYRSHLDINANSIAYNNETDKAAVTIINDYTENSDTWADADSIATDQACDVLITIADTKGISRGPLTGNAIAITTSVDNSYVPAMRIVSAGTTGITVIPAGGDAYGVKLTGTSFVAHNADYDWGTYAGFDTAGAAEGYAYRFEAPITAAATAGHNAYGISMTSATENAGATVLITKDVSATGGTTNYAVYGHNTAASNPGEFIFHFGGGLVGTPNTVNTTGDLYGTFFVDQYTTLQFDSQTEVTGAFTNDGTVDINAATTVTGLVTNSANGSVTIAADFTFYNGCTNNGTITVDGAAAIGGALTNNGTVDIDAETTVSGAFTNSAASYVTIAADTDFTTGCTNNGTITVDGAAAIGGELTNNGTVDIDAETTVSGAFTNSAASYVTIAADTDFTTGCTNNGTITVDAPATIGGTLTDDGLIAVNANAKFEGSLTGTGNITVSADSAFAVFGSSGAGYSLSLAPTAEAAEAAITCATLHAGIVAIKTATGGTIDHFGDSTNGAFTGQSTSRLLLAGNGGEVNGAITGFEKLIFGYHQTAPELTYDTDKTIDLGLINDTDTNAWTLYGAVTGKDIIVRHGVITAKGAVTLSGQVYVLGCNFCAEGSLVTAGGLYVHEETTTLRAATTISNGTSTATTSDFADLKSQHNVTDDEIAEFVTSDQMNACVTLNSSAEKGGAQLVVDSNAVTLNSITVGGENIGILAVGANNVIALNSVPQIKYYNSYTDASNNIPVTEYTSCYAVKGNPTTKLEIGKLATSSTLNGKVEVGEIAIDATGAKLMLTNNATSDGEGVLSANKITVDLISIDDDYTETYPTPVAKLEVANVEPFMSSGIAVEIKHLGGLLAGNKIPLVKCTECTSAPVAKQTFLTQYAITYDKTSYSATAADGYVATVTNSMTNAQAASKLGLNASYGRMLDSWHCTQMQIDYLTMMYGADEQTYTMVSNWSDRSDHMEKARITSSMMNSYNEVMLARRGVHNFDQEHKLISWISGFGDWFKQGEIKNLGAKSNTYGIIAGADYQLNDKWLFSLSCGYANSDVKLNGNHNCYSGSGHQDSFISSAAMAYKNKLGNGELSATGLFTSAFVRNKYNYSFQTTEDDANNTGHEKYYSFAWALGLDADWMLNYKDTAIKYGPIVQVGFDRTSQDGHTTTCSDSKLGFKTDEANVNNLWSILGAKVEYDCMLQQKKVNMYCQAGWKFQYLRNGANVGRELAWDAGSENKSFTATGTYVNKSMFALKLGASLFATESFNLGVEYGFDYNSKVHSNRANVEMSYMF